MFSPPVIVNDGHRIIATDYFDEGNLMRLAGHSWLDCHLGYLRVLYTGAALPKHRWSFCDFAILTRGMGAESVEMLELFFPSMEEERNPLPVYFFRWQCNRFPSWQPGKRCWELEVYNGGGFGATAPFVFFRRRVYFREGKVPCREWWTGPHQDGRPQPVPRRMTVEDHDAHLKALKEPKPPCAGFTKEKPTGRYLSEAEVARRVKRFQDRKERKR